MLKLVLFDLDGTLLPMDQDLFIKTYFGGLAKRLAPYGYEPKKLISGILEGTMAMIKNDGSKTNEEVFWDKFSELFGEKARLDEPKFEQFYLEDFDQAASVCGYKKEAKNLIDFIKEKGLRTILATNPIFPAVATKKRISWAGLNYEDFELVTTYENSKFCKPNLAYYKTILEQAKVNVEECLMVGNDVSDDMVVTNMGMDVFLLTDCLINRDNVDINNYPHGNFDDLFKYIENKL